MTNSSVPRRLDRRVAIVLVGVLATVAGCGTTDHDATEQQLAEQLVDATSAAGVAPRLTVQAAEALYGSDAPAVCKAFADGLSTSAENIILGNPGHGRRKTITDDAIEYGRLVVQTYCPQSSGDYEAAVEDLDPVERTTS